MPIEKELLEILCCPQTKVPVRMMTRDEITALNGRIEGGTVHYADGNKVETAFSEGLITEDGKTVYRIDDGIPVMLTDEGIPTDQFGGF